MILVTGGTGLIGSHLLYKLTSRNQSIRAIYRDKSTIDYVKTIFGFYTNQVDSFFDRIEWVKADITDVPELIDAFIGVDEVYHCAALISFNPNDFETLRKVNIKGTANVVNLCVSNKIKKLCYVSSIATLGSVNSNDILTEDSHWNPESDNSDYAITKYGAELEVWRASQEGVPVVIVNPGVVLGPGFWDRGSGKIFSRVKSGLRFYTKGVTGYIGVNDVVEIMIQLMQKELKNERFVLVSENLSFEELLKEIANRFEVSPPIIEARPWMLELLWRLDYLKSFFLRTPRRFTKQIVSSSQSKNTFDGTKVKCVLDYEYTPIKDVINNTIEKAKV